MSSEPVHYLSLMDVSAKLRSGELKPAALTETILARIARHDGSLRSYTTLLADRAMAKARATEEELNRGFWRGPLHGVPIAVKDLCYTDFAPTAAGMFIHKYFIPPYTGTVVERLERAGAIRLVKLSMTEGAFATHHPNMPTPAIHGMRMSGQVRPRAGRERRRRRDFATDRSAPTPEDRSAFRHPPAG
jgi:amidase